MLPFSRLSLPLFALMATCLNAFAEPVLLVEREGVAVPVSHVHDWKPGLMKEKFSVQAELSDLDGLAYWWPNYTLKHSTGLERERWPEVDARLFADLEIREVVGMNGKTKPSELSVIWPGADAKEDLVLALWILDGKISKVVRAQPHFMANGELLRLNFFWNLSEAETQGYPVLMTWRKGAFIAPAPVRMKAEFAEAFRAALKDDAVSLARLLDAGLPVGTRDEGGRALAEYAAGAGAVKSLEVLKQRKARFKEGDKVKRSPLELAASRGRTAAVQFLVKSGVSPNGRGNEFDSPLFCAAVNGHIETASALLALKADSDERTHVNTTPVVAAINEGYPDVAELLLKAGGAFEFSTENNRRAFLSICREGNLAMARFYVAHGAKLGEAFEGRYPLIEAAGKGSGAFAEYILKGGAKLDFQDEFGRTALIAACVAGNEPFAFVLLRAGAKTGLQAKSGTTALHAAVFRQKYDLVKALLAADAPSTLNNQNGLTPFDSAVIMGAWECVGPFLKAGATLDINSPLFAEELHSIIRGDQAELLAQLLQAGLSVEHKCAGGWSLRHLAELAKARRCLSVLVEAGARQDEPPPAALVKASELDAGFKFLSGKPPVDPRPEELAQNVASMKVRALVDAAGRVRFVLIDECAEPLLCVGLADTMDSWRFTPPSKGGQPAAIWVAQVVKFASAKERKAALPVPDVMPSPVLQVKPIYPMNSLRNGQMAEVVLRFTVNEKGDVINASVMRTSGQEFNQPALDSVRQWKFKPGKAKGVPIPVELTVPMHFSIE